MDKRVFVEFLVFMLFFVQIASGMYVYVYWSFFDIYPFYYLGFQDVVFAAKDFFIYFVMMCLFFIFGDYVIPAKKYFEVGEKKGVVISFIIVLVISIGLYYVAYQYYDSYYWVGALGVSMVLVKHAAQFLFNSLRKHNIFEKDAVLYSYLFLLVYGVSITPAMAISAAIEDSSNEFSHTGMYLEINRCEDCTYKLAGMLANFAVLYDVCDRSLSVVPADNINIFKTKAQISCITEL